MTSDSAMELIKKRRTNLRVDPDRPVPVDLIATLCEAAVWAPNHKLTEPWRFAVITGDGRRALGELAAEGLAGTGVIDPARLEKTRVKYLRAPAVVVVACAAADDPVVAVENRDAVAAGVQNLLLAATDAGLASYWATGLTARLEETRSFCRFEPTTEIVGLIYLGWPIADAPVPNRSPPQVTWVSDGPHSSQ